MVEIKWGDEECRRHRPAVTIFSMAASATLECRHIGVDVTVYNDGNRLMIVYNYNLRCSVSFARGLVGCDDADTVIHGGTLDCGE